MDGSGKYYINWDESDSEIEKNHIFLSYADPNLLVYMYVHMYVNEGIWGEHRLWKQIGDQKEQGMLEKVG